MRVVALMPAHPTDPALVAQAQQALAEHGSQAAAAGALGISRATIQSRLRVGGLYKPAEVAKPVLPSPVEPVEEWFDRREVEFRRRHAAQEARAWMRFEVRTPGPFGLVFVGDPHVDDDGCDLSQLRADLRLIEETPGLHGVGMGDWINNWPRFLGHLYGQQRATESDAYRAMEWVLSRPIWMLLLKGNHDLWNGAGNAMKWMMTHGAPVEDWAARFIVAGSGVEWKISAAHDFPGRSQYNKAHGPLKRAMFSGAEANLFVAGDKHCWTLIEDQDEHSQRCFWAARVRGYKLIDKYGSQLGFGSQGRGHSMVAVCDPADGSMVCFSSVEHGARYLTLLRAARGAKARVRVKAGAG